MEDSKIEWTDHTFNPWMGCTKVSEGCKNCYAEELMDKRYGKAKWGPKGTRNRTSKANWRKPIKWNKEAGEQGVRKKVFCSSLADVFEDHPLITIETLFDLFELILNTPNLDWLILTKRPERINQVLDNIFGIITEIDVNDYEDIFINSFAKFFYDKIPLPNIWFGTSVENQEQADKRIPFLINVSAVKTFLSMEPLLGPVDLSKYVLTDSIEKGINVPSKLIDWVIVGGESGSKARPIDKQWVERIQNQCLIGEIPFFFKQWGEWCSDEDLPDDYYVDGEILNHVNKHCWSDWDSSYKIGKKLAGAKIHGIEYKEMPGDK